MKKYFVVADVHGFYDEMIKALDENGFDINNSDHIFISLGDLLDRGRQPRECLDFVNNLPDDRKILICGNHEDLLNGAIKYGHFCTSDYTNRTVQTVLDLYDSSVETNYIPDQTLMEFIANFEPWLTYWNSLVNYTEIEDRIFVHGWIPSFDVFDKMYVEEDWENGDWETAKWLNGMHAWNTGARLENKTIYCGHWHTEWGHTNLHNKKEKIYDPFIDDGIVALDACTVISNKCNCVTFEI